MGFAQPGASRFRNVGAGAHAVRMTETVPALPDWVRPSAREVSDLHWLAWQRCLDEDTEVGRARAAGVAAACAWLVSDTGGPATGRPERPVTRAHAHAEMFAAMALCDGGATPEPQVRWAAEEGDVRFYPPDFAGVSLEQGMAVFQTLGWLMRSADGWERGRVPPMDIPTRGPDGRIAPGDPRSAELAERVAATRRRAAAERAHRVS